MQSIAMHRIAEETFSSRVVILPKLSSSESSTRWTCTACHGNSESDELDFRRDGSLPTAPAMTQHLGKSQTVFTDDLQVPCNAMPSQCIKVSPILRSQRGPTMTLPSWKDCVRSKKLRSNCLFSTIIEWEYHPSQQSFTTYGHRSRIHATHNWKTLQPLPELQCRFTHFAARIGSEHVDIQNSHGY